MYESVAMKISSLTSKSVQKLKIKIFDVAMKNLLKLFPFFFFFSNFRLPTKLKRKNRDSKYAPYPQA